MFKQFTIHSIDLFFSSNEQKVAHKKEGNETDWMIVSE